MGKPRCGPRVLVRGGENSSAEVPLALLNSSDVLDASDGNGVPDGGMADRGVDLVQDRSPTGELPPAVDPDDGCGVLRRNRQNRGLLSTFVLAAVFCVISRRRR